MSPVKDRMIWSRDDCEDDDHGPDQLEDLMKQNRSRSSEDVVGIRMYRGEYEDYLGSIDIVKCNDVHFCT